MARTRPRVVIIGVAVEAFVAVWILLASRTLQAIQERELQAMRLETARANERAAESARIAAEANKEAAEANEKAEHERLARLKLEAVVIRSLSWQQQARIEGVLKGLKGYANVELFLTYPLDPEINGIAAQIREALINAGWGVGLDIYKKHGDPLLGMLIEFESNDLAAQNIAAALASALQNAALVVRGPEPASLGTHPATPASPRTIWLTIGRR